ncbi:MAG: hypothetical protein ACI4L7_00170 [Christensenellales bacterium]
MLRELSPQDRKETFDYLESNYKYLLSLCEKNRASRNNMFDMFTFLSLKMFSFRNIEPLYYNYMLEQLTQRASNALWCSSEDDYKLASMQIKGNIDSLDQNDKEKFDKLLSNRMEDAKNNTYCPLSQEEYTLKEHQQRAYKLLKYLSEYSNEEKNAQSM